MNEKVETAQAEVKRVYDEAATLRANTEKELADRRKTQLHDILEEKASLEKALDEKVALSNKRIEAERQELDAEIEERRKKAENEINQKFAEKEAELKGRQKQIDARLARLEQEIQEKRFASLRSLEVQKETLETEIQEKPEEVKSVYAETTAKLETQISSQKEEARNAYQEEKTRLEAQMANLRSEKDTLSAELESLRGDIDSLENATVARRFAFDNSYMKNHSNEDFLNELHKVREKEVKMLKDNKALTAMDAMATNDDKTRKGKSKDTEEWTDLLIRAFNMESDAIISSVNGYNFDSSMTLLIASYRNLNEIGKKVGLVIDGAYLTLKQTELQLADTFALRQLPPEELDAMRETVIVTPAEGSLPSVEEAPVAAVEEPEESFETETTQEEMPVIVDDAESDEDEEL